MKKTLVIICLSFTFIVFTNEDANSFLADPPAMSICNTIYDACIADNPYNMYFATTMHIAYNAGCLNSKNICTEIME